MPSTTRTFIAIAVPEALGAKLNRLQSLLAPEIPGVRWSETLPFHITLAFLGDVEDSDLNVVCRAVRERAAGFGPLELRIEGLGVFPNPAKARTLWVGVTGDGLAPLGALQQGISAGMADLGYPPDEKFHPHVTIGRVKHGRGPAPNLTPALNHYKTWAAGSFMAREVITYSSTLAKDGPVYVPLALSPLAGGNPAPTA